MKEEKRAAKKEQPACMRCGSEENVDKRYSFGIYAGRLCETCCFIFKDHCGIGQKQGTATEYERNGEQYYEDD